MGIEGLAPSSLLLCTGVLLDAILGDPQVWFHPIRLMGRTLSAYENLLLRLGWNGYGGGCLLFTLLFATWVVAPCLLLSQIYKANAGAGFVVHALLIYTCFALRDLIDHVRKVQKAARGGDIAETRKAIGMLVGRDVDKMDFDACRRASIESISENFVDGVLSAVFWYVLLGLPGLLLFKVASTMDSMVGYKSEKYLYFGWCGARLDDLMNYIPARLSWLLLGIFAIPRGWRIGLMQHGILPGPNPGWSEATMAGVLNRKLIGPIWKDGQLVTQAWLGDSNSPEAGSDRDVAKAIRIIIMAALISVLAGVTSIHGIWGW
jgi:adenosylcobinamide-phosphate synthase